MKSKWLEKGTIINILTKIIGVVLMALGETTLGTALLGGSGSIFNLAQGFSDGRNPEHDAEVGSLNSRKLWNTVFMKVIGVILIFLGYVEEGTAMLASAGGSVMAGQSIAEAGKLKDV